MSGVKGWRKLAVAVKPRVVRGVELCLAASGRSVEYRKRRRKSVWKRFDGVYGVP